MKKRTFADLDFNFLSHPVSGDIIKVTNEKAIRQSVESLVKTNLYNRPFAPSVGSGLLSLMFENDTPLTRFALQKTIYNVINSNEPRVNIKQSEIYINWNPELVRYDVEVNYVILGMDSNVKQALILNRVR